MFGTVITTSCGCGWTFEVPTKRIGQETTCPGCGRLLVIQGGRSLDRRLQPAPTQEEAGALFGVAADGKCPFCRGEIEPAAHKCRHCSEWLNPRYRKAVSPPKWHRGVAAVLSLVLPGAGQIYKGQLAWGFLWLFLTTIGYFLFIVPGIVCHVITVIHAYRTGDPLQ